MKTLADIALQENERRAIEAAARLLRAEFPVQQVILFGSKARGSGDDESDLGRRRLPGLADPRRGHA
jgi:hypothetical protein